MSCSSSRTDGSRSAIRRSYCSTTPSCGSSAASTCRSSARTAPARRRSSRRSPGGGRSPPASCAPGTTCRSATSPSTPRSSASAGRPARPSSRPPQRATGLTPNKARALLGRFLFSGEEAEKPLDGLVRRRAAAPVDRDPRAVRRERAHPRRADQPPRHREPRGARGRARAASRARCCSSATTVRCSTRSGRARSRSRTASCTPTSAAGPSTCAMREERAAAGGARCTRPPGPRVPRARTEAHRRRAATARGRRARPKRPAANAAKPRDAGPSKNRLREQEKAERAVEEAEAALVALEAELADPAAWATKYEAAKSEARHTAAKRAVDAAYAQLETLVDYGPRSGGRRLARRSPPRTGCHRRQLHRDAVQHRVARQRVEHELVGEHVAVRAGAAAATRSAMPGASWPQPCGMLTTPGMIASVTSTGTCTLARARADDAPVRRRASPRRAASSGCTCAVQRGLPFASSGRLCIHELFERRSRRPIEHAARPSPRRASAARRRGDVGDDRLGRELDRARSACAAPPGCAAAAGRGRRRAARRSSASSVRRGRRSRRRSRRRTGRCAASGRAGVRGRVRGSPCASAAARAPRPSTRRPASRRADLAPRELERDLLVERVDVGVGPGAGGDRRRGAAACATPRACRAASVGRRVVGDVADRELVEREVVVAALQRRRARAGSRRRGGSSR